MVPLPHKLGPAPIANTICWLPVLDRLNFPFSVLTEKRSDASFAAIIPGRCTISGQKSKVAVENSAKACSTGRMGVFDVHENGGSKG